MKYLVLYWDAGGSNFDGVEGWAVYWWGTNKREARRKLVEAEAGIGSPDFRLAEVKLLDSVGAFG